VIEGRDVQAGLDVIDAGIRAFKAAGAELGLSNYFAISADGYRKIGCADRAWAILDEAFAMVERTAERFQLANLHRIRGDLLLDRGDAAGAEAEYLRAIEVARAQKALAWELRAATSLYRLRGAQGRRDEARTMLANVYGRFTEGFQTPDLVEAQALLAEPG
jgi:predicted ATPase